MAGNIGRGRRANYRLQFAISFSFSRRTNIGFLYLSSAIVFYPDSYREAEVRAKSSLNSSPSP